MINNFYLLLLLIFKHIVSSKSKKKKSNYKIVNNFKSNLIKKKIKLLKKSIFENNIK